MSFREKSAWIMLITLVLMTLAFTLHTTPRWWLAPDPSPFMFHMLMIAIGTFVGIVVVAHIVVAILAPRDVTAPKDERERLIELKSTAVAAYFYCFLTLGGVFVALHVVDATALGIGYLLLYAFVAAEIVNYGLRVYYYRRGF